MATTARTFTKVFDNMAKGLVNFNTHPFRVILLTAAGGAGLIDIVDTASTMTDVKAAAGFAELATSVGGSNYVQNANSHLSGQALTSTSWSQKTTTVAAGSNGVNTSSFAGAGTLNVATTAPAAGPAFPATGTLKVATGTSTATITYTGITSNSFTGCNTVSGGGVLATGGAVTSDDKVWTFTAASPTWTTAGTLFNPAFLVLFDDNGATDATNYPIGYQDFGGASLGNGGSWSFNVSPSGLFFATGS